MGFSSMHEEDMLAAENISSHQAMDEPFSLAAYACVKDEPCMLDQPAFDEAMCEEPSMEGHVLDYSFGSVLNHDINIGGVKVPLNDTCITDDDKDPLESCFLDFGDMDTSDKENMIPSHLVSESHLERTHVYAKAQSQGAHSSSHDCLMGSTSLDAFPVEFSTPYKVRASYTSELEQALSFFDN